MDILMPQLGETVAEGKITVWFKSVGDAVKPGDNLFEIETDKVSMEVPSTYLGRAVGNSRTGGRSRAGRLCGGGDRRRGRNCGKRTGSGAAAPAAAPPKAATPAAAPAQPVVAAPVQPSGPLDPFMEVRTPTKNFGPARTGGGRR